jgi:preprotein translocase subunit YajC
MNKLWKIGLVAGLLVTVLVLAVGCTGLFGTTTAPAVSGNTTGTTEGQSTWFSQYGMIIILVLIFAMFYFVMIRPQRKRQKEREAMMQGLQKGDRVITAGGIYGTVESLSEDTIIIKVEGGTTLRVARGSVAIRRDETKK